MNSNYWLVIALVLFFFYRFWRGARIKAKLPQLIARGAIIVDVRSVAEFVGGANPKSINIPIEQISEATFGGFSKDIPVILCCASGMRSGLAVSLVKKIGFTDVMNAGSWTNTLSKEGGG
jgi:phage shock protein E